jgi:hypothetical protein
VIWSAIVVEFAAVWTRSAKDQTKMFDSYTRKTYMSRTSYFILLFTLILATSSPVWGKRALKVRRTAPCQRLRHRPHPRLTITPLSLCPQSDLSPVDRTLLSSEPECSEGIYQGCTLVEDDDPYSYGAYKCECPPPPPPSPPFPPPPPSSPPPPIMSPPPPPPRPPPGFSGSQTPSPPTGVLSPPPFPPPPPPGNGTADGKKVVSAAQWAALAGGGCLALALGKDPPTFTLQIAPYCDYFYLLYCSCLFKSHNAAPPLGHYSPFLSFYPSTLFPTVGFVMFAAFKVSDKFCLPATGSGSSPPETSAAPRRSDHQAPRGALSPPVPLSPEVSPPQKRAPIQPPPPSPEWVLPAGRLGEVGTGPRQHFSGMPPPIWSTHSSLAADPGPPRPLDWQSASPTFRRAYDNATQRD